jgi:hypothetical protein
MTFLYQAAVGKCTLSNGRVQEWNGSGIGNGHLPRLVSPTFQFQGKVLGVHPLQVHFYIFAIYIGSPAPQARGAGWGLQAA